MNLILALAALSALGVVEVQAEPLNGPAVSGELASLSSQRAAVVTANGEIDLLLRDLVALDFNKEDPSLVGAATVWLELVDGSRLAAMREAYVEVAHAIAGFEPVSMVAHPDHAESARAQ